jgi:hypothetical protein
MKSFLAKDKKPLISWGSLPQGIFFEGVVPQGYQLCVCPGKYIVIDVDVDDNNHKNGFKNIPMLIQVELNDTFSYSTKRGGRHYWYLYTGDKILANKTSGLDIDLRIGQKKGNSGGYVVYYPNEDIRTKLHLIKETSIQLNEWLEKLFSYK